MGKKKSRARAVPIVVPTGGELDSREYRVPLWAFAAGKWGALVIALLVVLFFAFAGPISRAAARVPGLEREVTRLEDENSRVQQLAAALNRAEANYQELRQLLGVKAPPEKLAPTADLPLSTAGRARALVGARRCGTGTVEAAPRPR